MRARRARLDERELELTPKEFDRLRRTRERSGVVSCRRLLEEVWETSWYGSAKTTTCTSPPCAKLGDPGGSRPCAASASAFARRRSGCSSDISASRSSRCSLSRCRSASRTSAASVTTSPSRWSTTRSRSRRSRRGRDPVGSSAQRRPVAAKAYAYATSRGARVVIVDARGYARVDTSSARRRNRELRVAARDQVRTPRHGRVRHPVFEDARSACSTSRCRSHRAAACTAPLASRTDVRGRRAHRQVLVDSRSIAAIVLAAAAAVGFATARFVVVDASTRRGIVPEILTRAPRRRTGRGGSLARGCSRRRCPVGCAPRRSSSRTHHTSCARR